MKNTLTVWTQDRTCCLKLERRGTINWHCDFRGFKYEFSHVDDSYMWCGRLIKADRWNLFINGECNDSYPTLTRAVGDAIGYGLEFGK